MIYHLGQLPIGTNIVVRIVETSLVVIALGCFHQREDKRICVESGIQSKNNLRYININQLFHQLGEPLCKALPFYYAFTGCDYTSSFNRKGKIKPFKLLEKYPEIQEAFLNLSHSEGISLDIKSIIESFLCQMCGTKKTNSFGVKENNVMLTDKFVLLATRLGYYPACIIKPLYVKTFSLISIFSSNIIKAHF